MECNLFKYKKETATHWIGKSGKEYIKNDYYNHGQEKFYKGFLDLPKDDYPYSVKYDIKPLYKCCELCDCKKE